MKIIRFTLRLTDTELLKYYSGSAANVVATDDTGQTVQFPADALRPHVGPGGVYGRFALHVDNNHKLIKLVREGDL